MKKVQEKKGRAKINKQKTKKNTKLKKDEPDGLGLLRTSDPDKVKNRKNKD